MNIYDSSPLCNFIAKHFLFGLSKILSIRAGKATKQAAREREEKLRKMRNGRFMVDVIKTMTSPERES